MKLVKKIFVCVGIFLIPVVCGLAILPTVLSTSTGKNAVLRLVEKYSTEKVEVNFLSVGWMSGIKAEGISVSDKFGKKYAECASIYIHKPLIKWMYSWNSFGLVEVHSPFLSLYKENLEPSKEEESDIKHHKKALIKQKNQKAITIPGIQGQVLVDNAKVLVLDKDKIIGSVSEASVDVNVDLLHTSTGKIEATLSADEKTPSTPLSVEFSLDGITGDLKDASASFSVDVEELPVDFINAITSTIDPKLGDLLHSAFGSDLSYHLKGSIQGTDLSLSSHLLSKNITSDIEASLSKNVLTIDQGPLFKGTLSPELWDAFSTYCSVNAVALRNTASVSLENQTALQFDVRQKDFVSPFTIMFKISNPLLISFEEKEPIPFSLNASIARATKDIDVSLQASSTENATIDLQVNVQKNETGYKTDSTFTCVGSWPKIVEKAFSTSVVPVIGDTMRAEVRVESDIINGDISSTKGSTLFISPLWKHSSTFQQNQKGFSLKSLNTLPPNAMISECNAAITISNISKKGFLLGIEGILVPKRALCPVSFNIPFSIDLEKECIKATPKITQGDTIAISGETFIKNFKKNAAIDGSLSLQANITPGYMKSLQVFFERKDEFQLSSPVHLDFTVPHFQFVIPSTKETFQKDLFSSLKLNADFSVSQMKLQHQSKELGAISALSGKVDVDGSRQHIEFSLTPKKTEGAVSVEAKANIHDLFLNNTLDPKTASLNSSFTVQSFPTKLLEVACPGKGAMFEETLGKECSLQGSLSSEHMQDGKIKFEAKAERAFVHLDGSLQKGVFTLNSPAIASLSITKKAGELLLKDVNPLLATALHSEKPLLVTIDPQGVAIPLSSFSMTQLTLPKVTLDVGKILVKNTGALKIILALLRQGKAANSEQLPVWLTPMYINVQHGLVTCQRSDALVADELHFITWGTVDLVRDTMDMNIAVPRETLSQIGLQLVTAHPERGLQIPIRGSTSNPKIETARATAKLAGAGTLGAATDPRIKLLGGLIQAAASIGEEDLPIPPQTTSPLPWDGRTTR